MADDTLLIRLENSDEPMRDLIGERLEAAGLGEAVGQVSLGDETWTIILETNGDAGSCIPAVQAVLAELKVEGVVEIAEDAEDEEGDEDDEDDEDSDEESDDEKDD
jgi:hypothetical protein